MSKEKHWYDTEWIIGVICLFMAIIYFGGIMYTEVYSKKRESPETKALHIRQQLWTLNKQENKQQDLFYDALNKMVEMNECDNLDSLNYYSIKGDKILNKSKMFRKEIDSLNHVLDSIEDYPR